MGRHHGGNSAGRTFLSRRQIIASYMALGREVEAQAEAKKYNEGFMKRRGRPDSLKWHLKSIKSRPYKDPSWIDVHIKRLRKTGIPD